MANNNRMNKIMNNETAVIETPDVLTPDTTNDQSNGTPTNGTPAPAPKTRTIDQIKMDALRQTIDAYTMLDDEKSVAQKNALEEIDRFILQYKGKAGEQAKLNVAALALGLTPEEVGISKLKPELFKSAIVNYILPDALYPAGRVRADELALIKEQVYIAPKAGKQPKVFTPTEDEVRLSTALQRGGERIESFDLSDAEQVQTMQSLVFKVFYAACLYFEIPDKITRFLMLLITFNNGKDFVATNDQLAQFGKVHAKTIQRGRAELERYIDETQNAIVQMEEKRDEKGNICGTAFSLPFANFLTTQLQLLNDSGYIEVVQELTSKMQEQREIETAYAKRLKDAEATGDADKIKKVKENEPKPALDRLPENQREIAKELIIKIEDAKQQIQAPSTGTNERIAASRLAALKESARKVKSNLILIETPESVEAVKEIDRFLLEGTNFDKSNLDAYNAYMTDYYAAQDKKRAEHNAKLAKAASKEKDFNKALTGYSKLAQAQFDAEADETLDIAAQVDNVNVDFQLILRTLADMSYRCTLISEAEDTDEAKKAYLGTEYFKARLIEAIEFNF
jgi:hypothetical protein